MTQDLSRVLQEAGIQANYSPTHVRVYQAFPDSIADYALEHQQFGGDFSFNRMSWLKTSFLWMMHRSNWATEEHQKRILAISLDRDYFEQLINNSVAAIYSQSSYSDEEAWKRDLKASDVIYQLDNDRDLKDLKLKRKTLHLGLRKRKLKEYALGKLKIEDITAYVRKQNELRTSKQYISMRLPIELPYRFTEKE